MRNFAIVVLALLAVSCNQTGTAETQQYEEPVPASKEPVSKPSAPVVDPVPKKSGEVPEPADKSQKVVHKSPVTKLDPAILGVYRLVLSTEQDRQIDEAIKKMESDAAAGNKQAVQLLAMAKAAREMAQNMVVDLKPGGRFVADFGQGKSAGSYSASKAGVVLKPDAQSKDPDDPQDMELVWGKADKTLTAEFRGQSMVFRKKS